MQTNFTIAQLADPEIQAADTILRQCVHCGFCTATCPTYVLLGDELDGPRGRIYMIKNLLESGQPVTAGTRIKWPEELMGRNSVTPCTSAKTAICRIGKLPTPDI